jgi:hypothetical protein
MSVSRRLGRGLLLLTAIVAWAGILLQCAVSVRSAAMRADSVPYALLQVFAYFTVLTNLLVAVIATRHWRAPGRQQLPATASMFAATGVYILLVGITYSLLLRRLWAPEGLHRVADTLLHDVTPVLYVLWWLLAAPKRGLRWVQPLKWLAYPALYALFLLVLGTATGRYLYPFADVPQFGAAAVAVNALLMLGAFLCVGLLFVAVGRALGSARNTDPWHSGV